jgi:hypothetical protein
MNNQIRQPVINSRNFASRSSTQYLDKSLSNSFEDPLTTFLQRKPSFHSKNSLATPQSAFKSNYTLFKIDNVLFPQLLDKYKEATLFYRDEQFSQQSDHFLTKIAMDRRIPDEYRARFPIYQILLSCAKIFMFNEFEIATFACLLDHCSWNIDEVVPPGEGHQLGEFPSNLGYDISSDCRRFIIYLLMVSFSLKQYLGDKSETDQIQAYCETICNDFQGFFNKWAKVSSVKFNFGLPEVNQKYMYLSKRDTEGYQSTVKDYNMMVDEIMGLTGAYTTRAKEVRTPNQPEFFVEQKKPLQSQKTQIFHDFPYQANEPKPLYNNPPAYFEDKGGLSRLGTLDYGNYGNDSGSGSIMKMPSFLPSLSKQASFSNFMSNLPSTKRQPSENFEDALKKKLKAEENSASYPIQTQPSFQREPSGIFKPFELQRSFSNFFKGEEVSFSNFANFGTTSNTEGPGQTNTTNLPMLSKKASVVSQDPDDIPGLVKFQSNLSFLYGNN